MRNVSLKNLFTPQTIATALESLEEVESTIIDLAFSSSKNHQSSTIGISEINRTIGTVAFVKRDGTTVKLNSAQMDAMIFAPLPIKPDLDVLTSELNDLQVFSPVSKAEWVSDKVDIIRKTCRKTTEALASIVLTTGKLKWPIQLAGGAVADFEIDFGSPLRYTPPKLFDAADVKLKDVYKTLTNMRKTIQKAGYGGKLAFLAGEDAFGCLIELASQWASAGQFSPYKVELEEGAISIAGFKIYGIDETYEHPLDPTLHTPKIDPKTLLGFVKDSDNAKIFYCAIDSISLGNQAVPFHIFVDEKADSAVQLIGQTKPVPARNPKTVCLAKVVS